MKLLVALDGSAHALKAVRRLIDFAVQWRSAPEVHVLHVLEARSAQGDDAGLTEASEWLEGARLPVRVHAVTGTAAETIARVAGEFGCGMIWMGAHGAAVDRHNALGSTASRVLELTELPVVLVR